MRAAGGSRTKMTILDCLNDGTLHATSLDVFRKEPLSKESALWSHPRVTVTPHIAADSDPAAICAYLARQIENFEKGGLLQNVVDIRNGY